MKRKFFPVLIIFALLGLLVLLAGLQYKWLGQIRDAERVRLEESLRDGTKRFTEDFNREIQKIYYGFQIDAENFENKDWNAFIKSFVIWQSQTEFPQLVKDFYFLKNVDDKTLLKFDSQKKSFIPANLSKEISAIKTILDSKESFNPILKNQTALAIPVYKNDENVEKIVTRRREIHTKKIKSESQINLPEKFGFVIVVLDENTIKKEVLPNLTAKYFSNNESGDYKISVNNSSNQIIFQTHREKIVSADSTAKFFNIKPNNVFFFERKLGGSPADSQTDEKQEMIFSQTQSVSENKTINTSDNKDEVLSVNVQKVDVGKPNIAIFESNGKFGEGIWTLNAQHTSGSLEQFITDTRNKNLAVSFGILSLLAVSIILVFISSQRAKTLAQRQIDFVSSVSHEFRTPLAVIYSAGENLSDGLVNEKEKIESYGVLLKREGKKLSGMVEQILDFAGANSGKRKYDFRKTDILEVLDAAIRECENTIKENNFTVEKEFAVDILKIEADEKALTQAIQNLINNSLKYSNGTKWLKVSAENGGSELKITVEDKGIGISEKDKKQIFEPFYRSKEVVDEQISGSGLGLSLVKQIIEAHKGRIEVESKVGKGSKFIIHLPADI